MNTHPSTQRIVNTNLTVKHAQTIVIGGLIRESKSDDSSGAPWLIDIPIIRYLFGKQTKTGKKNRTDYLDNSARNHQSGGCGCRDRRVQEQSWKCHEVVQQIKRLNPGVN